MKAGFYFSNSLVFEHEGKKVVENDGTAHIANKTFGLEAYAKMRAVDTIDRFRKEHGIDVSAHVHRIRLAWLAYLNGQLREYNHKMQEFKSKIDFAANGAALFTMHPAPWGFETDCLSGYVVDANGKHIFGGDCHEGYVSEKDPEIVALVNLVNSVARYMKGE